MKVLHIITRFNQGGTAQWLERLSNEMREMGWESVLVAGVVGENEEEDICFQTLGGIKIQSLGKGKGLINDVRAFFKLRKIIREQNPDVVNTHTSKAGVLGRIAAITIRKSNIRVIHTYHGHLLYGYFSKPLTFFFMLIEKVMLIATDHFIVAGRLVRDQLIGAGLGSERQYSIIHPGVGPPLRMDSQNIRSEFGIPSDVTVVGWMGRFESIKAPFRVLELANHFPSIVFLMAGNGSLFEKIKSQAPENLFLPGWSDSNKIWSVSDIALLTSENEALPIVLIEAGLFGLPSIAENVGSVSEVVIDGHSGFLCHTFEQRAEALNLLHRNNQLRNQIGINASKYCLDQFNVQRFTENHLRVYLNNSSK